MHVRMCPLTYVAYLQTRIIKSRNPSDNPPQTPKTDRNAALFSTPNSAMETSMVSG